MSLARFFVDEELEDGMTLELGEDEARHMLRVMRKRDGDEVTVFDGRGNEARSVVAGTSGEVEVVSVLARTGAPSVAITLAIALPRGGAADDVMKKAIEAGASRIVPLMTARSVHRPKDAPRRAERFRRLAVSVLKQCGRNVLPELSAPVHLTDLHPGGDVSFFGATRPDAPRLLARLGALAAAPAAAAMVIGPEGGLAPEEEETLSSLGFEAVSLGPQILRIETAVVAATAMLASV